MALARLVLVDVLSDKVARVLAVGMDDLGVGHVEVALDADVFLGGDRIVVRPSLVAMRVLMAVKEKSVRERQGNGLRERERSAE